MMEEMSALDANGTWDSVSQLVGKKAIKCKWVFTIKMFFDGLMARLKG